jgi:hypothetical protein
VNSLSGSFDPWVSFSSSSALRAVGSKKIGRESSSINKGSASDDLVEAGVDVLEICEEELGEVSGDNGTLFRIVGEAIEVWNASVFVRPLLFVMSSAISATSFGPSISDNKALAAIEMNFRIIYI